LLVFRRQRRVWCEARPRPAADPDRDAPQPALKRTRIAQTLQPQQREQQRVLDAIIRQCRAGDASAQPREVTEVRRDARAERRAVAAERESHQYFVVVRATPRRLMRRLAHALSAARIWSASSTFWRTSCCASESTSFQSAGSCYRSRTRGHSASIIARAAASSTPTSAARRIACSRSSLPPALTTLSGAP